LFLKTELGLFENKVFGPKGNKILGYSRKLLNKELQAMNFSPNQNEEVMEDKIGSA
jgi:hypothetical protein